VFVTVKVAAAAFIADRIKIRVAIVKVFLKSLVMVGIIPSAK
jgi:hypothetical protein